MKRGVVKFYSLDNKYGFIKLARKTSSFMAEI